MRKTALLMALALSAGALPAAARQSTLSLSCDQARSLVRSQGAIVLSTGRHTYNRYVSRRGECLAGEYAARGWAPTRDGRCVIGFVCRPGDPLFDDD